MCLTGTGKLYMYDALGLVCGTTKEAEKMFNCSWLVYVYRAVPGSPSLKALVLSALPPSLAPPLLSSMQSP